MKHFKEFFLFGLSYYLVALFLFCSFWQVFSTLSAAGRAEDNFIGRFRAMSLVLEKNYHDRDLLSLQKTFWQIRGNDIERIIFRGTDQNDPVFKEIYIGTVTQDRWTSYEKSIPVVVNGANLGSLTYRLDVLALGVFSMRNNYVLFLVVATFVLCLFIIVNYGTVKHLRHLEKSLQNFDRLTEGRNLKDLEEFVANQVTALDEKKVFSIYPKVLGGVVSTFRRLSELEGHIVLTEQLSKMALQVAHDIRSPLSSMQAALGQFQKLQVDNPKYPELLNLLELSSKRLTGIADNLLQKHTTNETQPVIFSLHRILDELIGEYGGQDQYKEIHFVKKYPSQAIDLHGDPTKLQRAFGNIVKNAMEAMKGIGTITVQTQIGEGVLIAITDTGPGMAPETLQKVLLGGHTEGKQEGHGIGTKVVRETVTEFGGTIKAESVVGTGTTFFITLPLPAQETLQTAKREESAIEKLVIKINAGEPIVVVDDEPSLREQWRMTLADNGVQALLCESYEDVEEQKISGALSKTAVVDYHFDNSEKDGADVIKMLQGRGFKHLYLCTAEYWKPAIKRLAKDLDVTLCPKPLPKVEVMVEKTRDRHADARDDNADVIARSESDEAIPISKIKGEGYKVLVIDDDPLIGVTWRALRKKLNISDLHYFENLEKFIESQLAPTIFDIAFVDKNIDHSLHDGAQVVDYLKEQKLRTVVLASGENPEKLKSDARFANVDYFTKEKIPDDLTTYF